MSKVFNVIGGLIGKLMPKVDIPKIDLPAMPDPGSASSKIAAKKKIAERGKSGRESTIYSGGAYNQTNLGGTA